MNVCRALSLAMLSTLLGSSAALPGQQPAPSSTSTDGGQMTVEQQARFTAAKADFNGERWAEAAAKLGALHAAVPADSTVTKFLAEAEIGAGKPGDAVDLLQPVLTQNKDDVQALAIMAHAYAQQHKAAERDAALEHLQRLHDSGATKLQSLVLDRTPTTQGGSVVFIYFLEPWSRYNVSLMARVLNSAGQQVQRVTLESSDMDQVFYAKQHPEDAAKGARQFSMDGYTESAPNAQGVRSQTHATYGFFSGRPSFDVFHDKTMSIVEQRSAPMSTTSGIPVPAKQ